MKPNTGPTIRLDVPDEEPYRRDPPPWFFPVGFGVAFAFIFAGFIGLVL